MVDLCLPGRFLAGVRVVFVGSWKSGFVLVGWSLMEAVILKIVMRDGWVCSVATVDLLYQRSSSAG